MGQDAKSVTAYPNYEPQKQEQNLPGLDKARCILFGHAVLRTEPTASRT
jgi:hypothetical protein